MSIKVEKKLVTPAVAEQLLRNNIKNRALSRTNLQRLVDQMNDGEWQEETGESIKIASDGTLLDGQHRLTAIIQSGKSYEFLIISNLPNEAFNVIDTGKIRSSGDSLHIMGVKNYTNVAAMIKKYLYLKNGKYHNKQTDSLASTTKIVEEYRNAPEQWGNIFKRSNQLYLQSNRMIQQPMIGAFIKYLSETEPDECDVFFQKLCSGIGIEDERDPIYILRNMLIENQISDKKMMVSAKNAYLIVTWNSFLQGKKYSAMPWKYLKDEMPKPFRTKETALQAIT